MWAQNKLLKMIINYKDPKQGCFLIDFMPLQIEVEDIYSITGLPRWGEAVNLKGKSRKWHNIDDYIKIYCLPKTHKVGSQKHLRIINNMAINIFPSTIARVSKSTSLHKASWTTMFLAVECLTPIVYDWWILLLHDMKSQLIKCK